MINENYLAQFKSLISRMQAMYHAMGLLEWDGLTDGPSKGLENRAKSQGIIAGEHFNILISDDMKNCIDELGKCESELDETTKAILRYVKNKYENLKKIPSSEYVEYVELCAKSQSIWAKARGKNDFSMFAPYLEKIITFNKKFIQYRGYKGHPYNALIGDYEKGMSIEKLDNFFNALKKEIVPLVHKISESPKKLRTDFLEQSYSIEKQAKLSAYLLDLLGFDKEAGMVKESAHPFTTSFDPGDVRITTHYYENMLASAMYSTIHECGHALYGQHMDESLSGTPLIDGSSMGIHESQSRLHENNFGRNKAFIAKIFPTIKDIFAPQLDNVTADEFYVAVNQAKPSFVRTEADELTYSLHIMVRYEIEKALFEDKVQVNELPKIWNEMMEKYLGILPPTDTEGVLQDAHWAAGMFGYFPSYALGNAYAAQFEHELRKTLDLDKLLEKGEFVPIENWLTEHIHQFGGKITPDELVKKVTGEDLNPDYFINYLKNKFSKIYDLA